ncbi:MAG: aspartate/glutamate racemase family protein [Promethearchaeota archaeon]
MNNYTIRKGVISEGGLRKVNRIGILGGISYESTIKYYELILEKYYEKFKNYNYPEIIIFSLNFQIITNLERKNEKKKYIDYLMNGIKSLEKGGANFIVIAANSPHAVYNDLKNMSAVPILSILEAVAKRAQQENMKKLLLLGIKFTMQSSFYQLYFKNLGIEVITPNDQEQDVIEKVIFEELVIGFYKKESKNKIIQIINNYSNVDGIILGCTELPLVLQQKDTDIKLLDTIELHVEAALNYFLNL